MKRGSIIHHPIYAALYKVICLILPVTCLTLGCTSYPQGPYWKNPTWGKELQNRITAQMRYPMEATNNGFPTGTATVEFTYRDEKLTDIRIIKTTQSQILDDSIVQQLAKVKPPDVAPQYVHVSHRIETEIELTPSVEDFREFLLAHVLHTFTLKPTAYPDRAAKIDVEITYRDGIIVDNGIISTSGSNADYNSQTMRAVSSLIFPPTPAIFFGLSLTLKFRVWICKCGAIQMGESVQQVLEHMVEQHELPTIFFAPPNGVQ